MMNNNMKEEQKKRIDSSAHPQLTTEEKLENLAMNVCILVEKQKDMSIALDNVYVQVATLIEVLAMKEDILNPEIWEEKLKEVTKNIQEQMEAISISNNCTDASQGVVHNTQG